jgi:DNA-3-methyladenine glycosylase II
VERTLDIDYRKARRILSRRDPVIAGLMRAHGPCGLAESHHADAFQALVRAIVSQQLSTKAAATIAARVQGVFGDRFPSPAEVLGVPDGPLRGAGLSGQKLGYLRDLCRRIEDGSLPLEALPAMTDEQVIDALTTVKGIGRWTAEMFLIFRLRRSDVLPVGDLGIVKAVQKAYRLQKKPTPERLVRIAEAWRPYRSVACWYLWASLDNAPTEG